MSPQVVIFFFISLEIMIVVFTFHQISAFDNTICLFEPETIDFMPLWSSATSLTHPIGDNRRKKNAL